MMLRSGPGCLTSHKGEKSKKGHTLLLLPHHCGCPAMCGPSQKEIKDKPKPLVPDDDSAEKSTEDHSGNTFQPWKAFILREPVNVWANEYALMEGNDWP